MDNATEVSVLPVWRTRGYPAIEEGAIEYRRLRIVVHHMPKRVGWFVTVHPIFRSKMLTARSFEDAKYEAIFEIKQELSRLLLKSEILFRATEGRAASRHSRYY